MFSIGKNRGVKHGKGSMQALYEQLSIGQICYLSTAAPDSSSIKKIT